MEQISGNDAPVLPQVSASAASGPAPEKTKRVISEKQKATLEKARAAKAARKAARKAAATSAPSAPDPVGAMVDAITAPVEVERKRKREDVAESWAPKWGLNSTWTVLGLSALTVGLVVYSGTSKARKLVAQPQAQTGFSLSGWKNVTD